MHRQAALLLHAGCSFGCWRARILSSAASWDAGMPQAPWHVSFSSAPGPGQSGQVQASGSGLRTLKRLKLLLYGMLTAEWLAAGCREGLLFPDVLGRPPSELHLPVCVTNQCMQRQSDLTAPSCRAYWSAVLGLLHLHLLQKCAHPGRRYWGLAKVSSTGPAESPLKSHWNAVSVPARRSGGSLVSRRSYSRPQGTSSSTSFSRTSTSRSPTMATTSSSWQSQQTLHRWWTYHPR